MSQLSLPQAVWRGGSATSQTLYISGCTLSGLHIPSVFSGTSLTFTVSDNNAPDGNFSAMIDDTGTSVSYTVSASKYVRVRPADFAGVGCFRIVSSATEAANTAVKAAVREIA